MTDLTRLDGTAHVDLVKSGKCRPSDLVEAAIARIDTHNHAINAVIHRRDETAAREAQDSPSHLPLAGLPVVVKDLGADTAGDPYHCGMRALARRGWRAAEDAHVVRRLRSAGAVIVGRTNTSELASSFFTEPLAYGPTRNPWDVARSPGGSSGGSAAAVAAGLVPVAHGNDMAGSVRVPAAMCGVVGLKPTRGRISAAPLGERWGMFGHEGVLARSVRDCAALLDALAGTAVGDPYGGPPRRSFVQALRRAVPRLRVGLRTEVPVDQDQPDAACVAAVEVAAQRLADHGHDVTLAHPTPLDDDLRDALTAYNVSVAHEVDRWEAQLGEPIIEELERRNQVITERGRSVSGPAYLGAVDALQAWARSVALWWAPPTSGGEGFDVLVTPTTPMLPPPIGWGPATRGAERRVACFTWPWNITGQPAVSLPLATTPTGLPVGVQLVAATAREDVLLAVAAQLMSEPAPVSHSFPMSTTRSD